ncbi:MAG: biotin/lipoate--protein ligase family protein [Pseudomonadota bacterium]
MSQGDGKAGDPTFPPMLSGFAVSAPDAVIDVAVRGANAGRFGAGDVLWARNTQVLDWAIVLEPEVPLREALQMVPLAMVAAGDCIGALTPPKVALAFTWPGTILVNAGRAGFIGAAFPSVGDDVVPDWLVVHAFLRLRHDGRSEPGDQPDETVLAEEGCPDLTRTELIESYSRHVMSWLDTWRTDGFKTVHGAWMRHGPSAGDLLPADGASCSERGEFIGLDEDGGLLRKGPDGAMTTTSLIDVFRGDAAGGTRAAGAGNGAAGA